MQKTKTRGVKKITAQGWKERGAGFRLGGSAVKSVTNNGMTKGGEMDADLVRPPAVQIGFQKCVTGQAHAYAPVGAGRAAFAPPRGHADTTMEIA